MGQWDWPALARPGQRERRHSGRHLPAAADVQTDYIVYTVYLRHHRCIMSNPISLWWFSLCAVSVVNIVGLSLSVATLRRQGSALPADVWAYRRIQLLLSAGYVFGCAFRSAFPVYDVQRLALVDSWLSSVVVGRSVATFAELCFATQWALLLREIARATGSRLGTGTSMLIVPLIAIAEVFSWYSVLTTSNIGHVVEESLWGISAVLLVVGLVAVWPRCARSLRPFLAACCISGVAYVFFMFLVDVPMYWSRWIADQASGRSYLGLAQGIADVSGRWVVSHRWQDWHSEMAWMSLYFSVAVWSSIALVHAPLRSRTATA